MRTLLSSRPSPFALSAGVAVLCVAAACLVLAAVSVTPPLVSGLFAHLERAWSHALSAGVLIPLSLWLRRRYGAAAYGVLVASCVLAGWAIQTVGQDYEGPGRLLWPIELLAGLALVPAPATVVAAFASTPPRRLGKWSPIVLGMLVGISVVAVIGQSEIRTTGGAYSGIGQTLVDWFSSPLVTIGVVLVAVLGSIRAEAQRFVPSTAVSRRDATVPRDLAYFFIAALTLAGLAVPAGLYAPDADRGQALLPLLAALVAMIGARWSAYVAWAAVALSLAVGAVVIFGGMMDIEIQRFVESTEAPWVPTGMWLPVAGFALAGGALAIAAASRALIEARKTGPKAEPSTMRAGTIAAVAIGVVAWATALRLLWRDGGDVPLLEGPFWTMYMTIGVLSAVLLVGATEAVRARLVPAVAEAEATARRPLRPFRYLETVMIETLTGRATLRRSAMAAERSKLASDLHAQILPSLADIRTQYESGAPGGDLAVRLRRLEHEVRDLMAERRLVLLEEFGIVEAIEWLIGRAEERTSLGVQLSVDDRSTSLRPPREVERAAFRIAQLAVENALQHASPTRLELQVLARSDEVRIAVVDDGRGFHPVEDRDRDHLGISDMRTQAAEVRGDVTVVSPASGGTMVTFAWPAA